MIRTNPDGSLSRTNSSGITETFTFFDAGFGAIEEISGRQTSATNANNTKRTNYMFQLGVTQHQIDTNVTGAPLVKPLMHLVDDFGNESDVPFDPPLPDPVQKTDTGVLPGTGSIATVVPDYQKQTWQMVNAIYTQFQKAGFFK